MKMEEMDKLAEILCKEINRHRHMNAGEKVGAAMMLIADIVATVGCPDCRDKLTTMVKTPLPAIMEEAKEHATTESQHKHRTH
jgi:hypothetical protein